MITVNIMKNGAKSKTYTAPGGNVQGSPGGTNMVVDYAKTNGVPTSVGVISNRVKRPNGYINVTVGEHEQPWLRRNLRLIQREGKNFNFQEYSE